MSTEDADLLRHLQEATPSALKIPNRNADGLIASNPAPPGSIAARWPATPAKRTEYQAPFPESTSTTSEDVSQTSNTNEYSFELEVDKIDSNAGSVRIHVGYGEINDTPPTGMTGADDYFLTITVDGTEIWAVITYDTSTLAITSRNLGFGASVPDPTFGSFCVPIGSVDFTFDPVTGKITSVDPHNRHCGDINFVLTYGDLNGVPAVIPVCAYAPLVAVT